MSSIIQVNNISKQYRLGQIGTGTISHDLNRWWYRVRGKEDPFLKIGEENDRSKKGKSEIMLKHYMISILMLNRAIFWESLDVMVLVKVPY